MVGIGAYLGRRSGKIIGVMGRTLFKLDADKASN
jgi:hypothetical protein